jgi:hypothetical protein
MKKVVIDNVVFEGHGDIKLNSMYGEGMKVSNSLFHSSKQHYQGMFNIKNSNSTFVNSTFTRDSSLGEIAMVSGIVVSYDSKLHVKNCSFLNLASKSGAAI